ncbi:unnamed protein product [Haemonchus placei]|uniref:Ovule protein n=1 Tax=Haemonchus placei TaxID=6290 RepID=A0A0N4XB17_HAEPC|nr:unnamed protein product [Haemonchus placei]
MGSTVGPPPANMHVASACEVCTFPMGLDQEAVFFLQNMFCICFYVYLCHALSPSSYLYSP